MTAAARCLRDVADAFEQGLGAIDDAATPRERFWERGGGLELVQVSFEPQRCEFVVTFRAGARYRLPLRALHEVGDILAVGLDEFRHGVVVVFADGTSTSFASDLVLFECEPEYRSGDSPEPAQPHVGETVRALRVASGRTAAEVAEAAGMAPPNYARLEASRHAPRVDTLVRVAEALGVPLARLFQPQPSR
jgi:hypothetical protein